MAGTTSTIFPPGSTRWSATKDQRRIRVHSDTGISEKSLELDLRPWLQQQGIVVEISKNHVQ